MTLLEKQNLMKQISNVIDLMVEEDKEKNSSKNTESVCRELLTVSECVQLVDGLTEYAVRQLVAQNKVKHIRVGEYGKRGKILISKSALLEYLKLSI